MVVIKDKQRSAIRKSAATPLASRVVMLVVGLAMLVGLSVLVWQLARRAPVVNSAAYMPFIPRFEVKRIVDAKLGRNQTVFMGISSDLAKLIDRDPDYVIWCLGFWEAIDYPGFTSDEEAEVMQSAGRNSKEGLTVLCRCVSKKVAKEMKTDGYDPEKDRWAWYGSHFHFTTALLFVDLPLAERLGRRKELIRTELEDLWGAPRWYEAKVTDEQYRSWRREGKWPFVGEKPPKEE